MSFFRAIGNICDNSCRITQQTSPLLQPLNKWILRAFELIRGGGLSNHFHNDMVVITPNNEKNKHESQPMLRGGGDNQSEETELVGAGMQ